VIPGDLVRMNRVLPRLAVPLYLDDRAFYYFRELGPDEIGLVIGKQVISSMRAWMISSMRNKEGFLVENVYLLRVVWGDSVAWVYEDEVELA
jgi:hypothetical protein